MAKNKTELVLLQKPNLPLIVWFVALVVSKILNSGVAQDTAEIISFVAILIWAGLEIFSGVNYFRRGLGLTVLLISLFNKFY